MPKVTIYLPDQLAAEVKAAGISVSPVCQRALEQEVRIMEATKINESEIREAAMRLRSEEADETRQAREDGTADGRRWMLHWAKPSELRRMESVMVRTDLYDRIPQYESQGFSHNDVDAPFQTIREMLANDDPQPDYGDDANFEYWAAFEDSAMVAYDQVNNAHAGEGEA